MKSISNKEENFSLHNLENYKVELDTDITYIVNKISELFLDYFKYIIENIKFKKNNFSRFIITRGLDTVVHVFNNVLFYTKNIELTYFHCQKTFYFYVEFVGQISDDEKMFLQLSSRDATTYVYKKTIFEINHQIKKNNDVISDYTKLKLDIIHEYIDIYKTYLYKLINGDFLNNENLFIIETIFKKINNINDKSSIKLLNKLTEKLYYKIIDNDNFYRIQSLIIKKFTKNPDLFLNFNDKFTDEDFDNRLNEQPDKFVAWFIK
jgi:hypothetical protein